MRKLTPDEKVQSDIKLNQYMVAYRKTYYEENKQALSEKSKISRQTLKYKFSEYKSKAKTMRRAFDITAEEFADIWQQPCHYCGSDINTIGLDRVDSTVGYTLSNVVPCCFYCNHMKLDLDLYRFTQHLHNIQSHKNAPVSITHDNNFKNYMWGNYRSRAKRSGKSFTLTKQQFSTLLLSSCVYCGGIHDMGIDRIDSSRGYELDNSVSCCCTCNSMKLDKTVAEFYEHISKIVTHLSSKQP